MREDNTSITRKALMWNPQSKRKVDDQGTAGGGTQREKCMRGDFRQYSVSDFAVLFLASVVLTLRDKLEFSAVSSLRLCFIQ